VGTQYQTSEQLFNGNKELDERTNSTEQWSKTQSLGATTNGSTVPAPCESDWEGM